MNNGTEKYFKNVTLNPKMARDVLEDGPNVTYNITQKIAAQVIDVTEKALVDAIVKAAYEEGVNDLFLIDKDFIMSAIKREMDFRKGARDK